jgi:hypothetical protein
MHCGGQREVGTCGWCGRQIGGLNYVPVARPGHEVMEDNVAKQWLANLIIQHENNVTPGYTQVKRPEPSTVLTNNNLQPPTWRLLRLFTHLPLLFLHMSGQVN